MNTYLLTWNPAKWTWEDHEQAMAQITNVGHYDMPWSCGNRKTMPVGSRFFLLRQGKEPRGIIGSGKTTSEPFTKPHWNGQPGKTCSYVDVCFDRLFDEQTLLPREALNAPGLKHTCWKAQSSGGLIPKEIALELERVWASLVDEQSPEHIYEPPITLYAEGTAYKVTLTRYERNKYARQACLDHHGYTCSVCQMNFLETYETTMTHFIHVHHITPLAQIGEAYEVDPIKDLRPVCPNCHAVIHSKYPPYRIEEIRRMLQG